MNKVLVIGASGQLGSVILKQLLEEGRECVALIRPSSKFNPPGSEKLQVTYGDLADYSSIKDACVDIKQVITTASSIVPRKGDKFGVDEVEQYQSLIKACLENKVEHLIFISAFSSSYDELVPEFQVKREIEDLIINSGVPYTIFRAAAFMDIYFAVIGSSLVIDGVLQPTLLRGFWLTKLYSKLTSGLLENHGIALLPGNGKAKQAFICIKDVACFMVKALTLSTAKNRIIELGGPEVLSWREVANIYAELLNKRVIKLAVPSFILNTFRILLKPFSPAGENLLSILFLLGKYDFSIDMRTVSEEFSIRMTDTRQFLTGKLNTKHGQKSNEAV